MKKKKQGILALLITVLMVAGIFYPVLRVNALTLSSAGTISLSKSYSYFPFDGTDSSGTPFAYYVEFTGKKASHTYYLVDYFYVSSNSKGYIWNGTQWTAMGSNKTDYLPIQTGSDKKWSGWIFCKTDSNDDYGSTPKFRIKIYDSDSSAKSTATVSSIHLMDMDSSHSTQAWVDTQGGWIEGHAYLSDGTTLAQGYIVVVKNSAGDIVGAYATENNSVGEGYTSTDAGYYKVAVPEGSSYSVELWDPSTNQIVGSAVTGINVSAHSVTSNIDINHSGGTTGPQVTSTVPQDGATNVPVNTTISATFNKDMDSSTINTTTFTVKDSSGNSVSGTVAYDSTTKTATFTPGASLAKGTSYTATISGTVKDTNGNQMGSDYSWSFTTETQITNPSVETLDATNIQSATATLNGNLTDMGNASSVTVYFQYGTDTNYGSETTHETMNATGNFSADISGLSPNTTYHFRAVATNSAGTTYGNDRTFTTGSLPQVTSTVPQDGATNVPVNATISATFNKDMDSSTINTTTFTVKDSSGNSVSGTVAYDSTTKTATFTPGASLAKGTSYTATISGTVKDTNGNQMGSDYSWSFTTETEVMPIGTVRNMSIGSQVYIQGIVTLPTGILFTNNREFYLQDGTGGIAVYYGEGGLPDLQEGYVVKVKGTLDKYGVLEVKPSSLDDVQIVSNTSATVPPVPITLDQVSDKAGWLVVTNGTVQGDVVSKSSYSYFMISDGTNSVKVFVDKDTNIDLSEISDGKEVTIEGIAELCSSKGTDTPEIIVRFQSDITTAAVTPPSAPSDLTATGKVEKIVLNWKASNKGTYPIAGYAIYRGTSFGRESGTPIATVDSHTLSFTDKNVKTGVTYYYVVKAFDNQNPPNYSEPSNEAFAKPKKKVHYRDITPPVLNVKTEVGNFNYPDIASNSNLSVTVFAFDNSGSIPKIIVKDNNVTVLTISNFPGKKSFTVPLFEGINDITILTYDPYGNVARKAMRIISDTKSPIVKVKNLPESVMSEDLTITGTALDITTSVVSLEVNGKEVSVVNGKFSCVVPLKAGKNTITIVAVDKAGNKFEKTLEVTKVSNNSVRSKVIGLSIGNPYIVVNGVKEKIDAQGSKPIIENNRTLLPVRSLIEALGGTVEWNAKTRQVTISLDGNTIILTIGKNTALVNGIETPIDPNNPKVVPIIINGRTYLPLRFIAEHLNCMIQWDPATKTITIYYYG